MRRSLEETGWERLACGIVTLHNDRPLEASLGLFLYSRDRVGGQECRVRALPGESPIRSVAPELPRGERVRRSPQVTWRLRSPAMARVTDTMATLWFGRPEAAKRIAREVRDLDLLRRRGGTGELKVEGDTLVLRLGLPDGRNIVFHLEDGFPKKRPRLHSGQQTFQHWNRSETVAQQVVTWLDTVGPRGRWLPPFPVLNLADARASIRSIFGAAPGEEGRWAHDEHIDDTAIEGAEAEAKAAPPRREDRTARDEAPEESRDESCREKSDVSRQQDAETGSRPEQPTDVMAVAANDQPDLAAAPPLEVDPGPMPSQASASPDRPVPEQQSFAGLVPSGTGESQSRGERDQGQQPEVGKILREDDDRLSAPELSREAAGVAPPASVAPSASLSEPPQESGASQHVPGLQEMSEIPTALRLENMRRSKTDNMPASEDIDGSHTTSDR